MAERVIVDNAKCAIVNACAHDPLVQRAYACPPHDLQRKGILKSGGKYLTANFLPMRHFRDLADLNAQASLCVMQEAGVRVHGTTREKPLVLFEAERPASQGAARNRSRPWQLVPRGRTP